MSNLVLAICNETKTLMLRCTISEIYRKELLSVEWACTVGAGSRVFYDRPISMTSEVGLWAVGVGK
jgi:hypothetical protein